MSVFQLLSFSAVFVAPAAPLLAIQTAVGIEKSLSYSKFLCRSLTINCAIKYWSDRFSFTFRHHNLLPKYPLPCPSCIFSVVQFFSALLPILILHAFHFFLSRPITLIPNFCDFLCFTTPLYMYTGDFNSFLLPENRRIILSLRQQS